MSGGQPKSLSYGSSSNIPIFEIGGNENEFGVIQSPHTDCYIHSHLREKQAKGLWVDKDSNMSLKPMEINLQPPDLPTLIPRESNPQLTKSQSSKELSVLKLASVFDECQEEMFQLDDESDDLMPSMTLSQITKQRKMSKSHDKLNESIQEMSRMAKQNEKSRGLSRFKSDSNLNHERSDMSLVEKVSLMNLTASKKSDELKPMNTQRQISHESFDSDISDSESKLKNWFLKKPVSMSQREINAISPFP